MTNRNLKFCTCGKHHTCLRNGVLVKVDGGSYAMGDLYGCQDCGYSYITALGGWLDHTRAPEMWERMEPQGLTLDLSDKPQH